MQIRTLDYKYLNKDSRISLFFREENNIYFNEIDGEIKNSNGFILTPNFLINDIYILLFTKPYENQFKCKFTYIKKGGKLLTIIEDIKYYVYFDPCDMIILSENIHTHLIFEDKNKNEPSNNCIRITDRILERKIIPSNIYIKELWQITSIRRGNEDIIIKHILINNKEYLIPEIYKASPEILIMEKYPYSLDDLKIIDKNNYQFKNKIFYFNCDIKEYIIEKICSIIEELYYIGISHNELIISNFVTSEDLMDIRIIDFGMSEFINDMNTIKEISEFQKYKNIETMEELLDIFRKLFSEIL